MTIASAQDCRQLLTRAYARRDCAELDLYEIQARRRAVVRRLTDTFGADLGLRIRELGAYGTLAAGLHRLLGDLSVAWVREARRIHRLNRVIARVQAELVPSADPEQRS